MTDGSEVNGAGHDRVGSLDALPVGYRIHWYTIENVLGQGGFGITYLARDEHLGHFAIKEYIPRSLARRTGDATVRPVTQGDEEAFKKGLESFLREARTLYGLEHHPNIVRVHAVFELNNTAYMVMDFEKGQTLDTILKEKGVLGQDELVNILLPVLDGLEVIHAAHLIHRDIKPGNIRVRPDGSPALLDFGSARQETGSASRTLTTIYSPGYSPREQYVTDGAQGPWTDIYAVAATAYHAVTGKAPAESFERNYYVSSGRGDPYVPVAEAAQGNYKPALLAAIDAALRVGEEDRPRNVDVFRQMLLGERPVEPPAGPPGGSAAPGEVPEDALKTVIRRAPPRIQPPKAAPEPPRRGPAVAVVAGGLVFLVLAGGAYVWLAGGDAPEETEVVTQPAEPPPTENPELAQARRLLAAGREGGDTASLERAADGFRRLAGDDAGDVAEAARAGLSQVADAYLDLAGAARQSRDYDAALDLLDRAAAAGAAPSAVQSQRARVGSRLLALAGDAADGGDFDEAEAYLERARAAGADAGASQRLAQTVADGRQRSAAASELLAKASAAVERGEYRQAKAFLDEARRAGAPEAAILRLEPAVDAAIDAEESPAALLSQAGDALSAGDHAGAGETALQARAAGAPAARVEMLLARIAAARGDEAAALRHLQLAEGAGAAPAEIAPLRTRMTEASERKAVAALVENGREALRRNHLTLAPAGRTSAWDYFKEALARDPSNVVAGEGLKSIVKRYLQMSEDLVAEARVAARASEPGSCQEKLGTARQRLERAAQIGVMGTEVDTARQALAGERCEFGPARKVLAGGRMFQDRIAPGSYGPVMVNIQPGTYTMGDQNVFSVLARRPDTPPHEVRIRRPFAVSETEVTFEAYDAFARDTGRPLPPDDNWGRGSRPVIHVGWEDAAAYARWLASRTGQPYRLLSEAEWEYVARAGRDTGSWWSTGTGTTATGQGNCAECGGRWAGRQTAPVGSFPANPWGLKDVSGNVWEWVQDCWHPDYYGAPDDGSAWTSGPCKERVVRGGAWGSRSEELEVTTRQRVGRDARTADIGFRVIVDLEP